MKQSKLFGKYTGVIVFAGIVWLIFYAGLFAKTWLDCDGYLVRTVFFFECVTEKVD